jgi:Homeodomain-like domain
MATELARPAQPRLRRPSLRCRASQESRLPATHRAVLEVLEDGAPVTEVARRYGVARQTVHEWLARYASGDSGGWRTGRRGRRGARTRCPRWWRRGSLACGSTRGGAIANPLGAGAGGVTPLPGRPAACRALIRHGLADPKKRKRRREDYRRRERGRAMQLWQTGVTGPTAQGLAARDLADGVVILDQPTALDGGRAAAITDAAATLSHCRTGLVIARQLQTIRAAERILFPNAGCVVEAGQHDQLLAAGGRWAHYRADAARPPAGACTRADPRRPRRKASQLRITGWPAKKREGRYCRPAAARSPGGHAGRRHRRGGR